MDFGTNKMPVEELKKVRLAVLILETFILVLLESGTENHEKNLISWKILIRSIITQIIRMLVSKNMVLNAVHR